jgi:hypothetical protein
MRLLRRAATMFVTLVAAFSIAVSSVSATQDTYYGHLAHDGALTWFTGIQRHHVGGGGLSVQPNNGPNGNGAMRMGLAWQQSGTWTQFTHSIAISCYNNCLYLFTDVNTNSYNFTDRWFIIDARMVDNCNFFCDDDFGGLINF